MPLMFSLHTYIHTYNLYLCVKSKIAVIQPLTGDTKFELNHDRFLSYSHNCYCSFPIFISRFRRRFIIVVSFILSAAGAIGALLDNDDDKGKTNLTN